MSAQHDRDGTQNALRQGTQHNRGRKLGEELRQGARAVMPQGGLVPVGLADYEAAGQVYPLTIC
jgi:hypothetical protein